MYLLDTNTPIYYFKGNGKVAVHLVQVIPGEVAIPRDGAAWRNAVAR